MSQIIDTSRIVQLRYSLNGITNPQIQALFSQIEKEQNQLIIKRVSDSRYALSADDMIIEGDVSNQLLNIISQSKLEPLSCKIAVDAKITDSLRKYSAFNWINRVNILSGLTIMPINQMQQLIPFKNPTHFLNLVTSTEAGSYLRPLLAVKPRGLVAVENNILNIIFPAHRVDFYIHWLNKLKYNEIDLDWLSGSTSELPADIVQSIGSIDQAKISQLNDWLDKANTIVPADLNFMYRRALASLQ